MSTGLKLKVRIELKFHINIIRIGSNTLFTIFFAGNILFAYSLHNSRLVNYPAEKKTAKFKNEKFILKLTITYLKKCTFIIKIHIYYKNANLIKKMITYF